jgi:PIN domain nuclease of toxin-antitoxin system
VSGGLLIDTNVLIWTLSGNTKTVSTIAKRRLQDPNSALIVSIVSVWEIVLKHQAGKLDLDDGIEQVLNDVLYHLPWRILPVMAAHVHALVRLPMIHKDPFDRLLVAQARHEGLTIVTSDEQIRQYEVPILW